MPKTTRWLAFSCPHLPIADTEGLDWLLDQIRETKPDVVVSLGDVIDAGCLSSFAQDRNQPSLDDEYQAVDTFLGELIDAAPMARRIYMEGNHEERMFRLEHQHLSQVLDYRRHLRNLQHFTVFPYVFSPDHTFRLGQVTFWHGKSTGIASCKRECIQLGVPNGLYVYGHTHRPHDVHRISMGVTKLPYWHANPGTFIQRKPSYMRNRDDSLWGQGIIRGEATVGRRHTGRQLWSAELVLRKMAWDTYANEP